jgi:hypothetical protein
MELPDLPLLVLHDDPEREFAYTSGAGAGRPLAQRLVQAGERVVNVAAKLAARVRLFDTGHNRKTDALDAHSMPTRSPSRPRARCGQRPIRDVGRRLLVCSSWPGVRHGNRHRRCERHVVIRIGPAGAAVGGAVRATLRRWWVES